MFKFDINQKVILDGKEAVVIEQMLSSESANYYKLSTKEGIRYEYEIFIEEN